MEEFGSLSGMETGGGEITAVQFGGSEIDQNEDAVTPSGRAGIGDCFSEHLACVGVVASPEEDVSTRGSQLRAALVAKPRRGTTTRRLVQGILRAVEGVPRRHVVFLVGMDGGFDDGEP